MTPHEWNNWVGFLIIGVPIIRVFGGPFGWAAMWILAFLALLFLHPLAGLIVGAVIVLWRPLKWLVLGIFLGEGLGLGLRGSGFASRLSRRSRYPCRLTRDELAELHARQDQEHQRQELVRRDAEWNAAAPRARGRPFNPIDTGE